jgi:hypothetical protein
MWRNIQWLPSLLLGPFFEDFGQLGGLVPAGNIEF